MFGDSFEVFLGNIAYQKSIAMSTLRIGEYAYKLTKEFKTTHDNMPWDHIIKLRHIAVFHYKKLDMAALWKTAKLAMPKLKFFCQTQLDSIKNKEVTG